MKNDLENIGKTMPYTVPDGFFETMEERLMQEVTATKKKPRQRNVALWTGIAIAASLALLLVLRQGLPHSDSVLFEQMEVAFNQLSEGDQQLMLEYYDEMDYLDND